MREKKIIEYLCGKGFYGVLVDEIGIDRAHSMVKEEGVEIVTQESVEMTKTTLSPNHFIKSKRISKSDYIRADNANFMAYSTKGRFKFNKVEYFFIFHELILAGDSGVLGSEIRKKLRIDAKTFFYFTKKLIEIGIITRKSEMLYLLEGKNEIKRLEKDFVVPQEYYKDVPIYTQVWNLLQEKKEGVSSHDLRQRMGMGAKQALHILKKVCEWNKESVVYNTGFEGTIKRNWYKMKKYHDEERKGVLQLINHEVKKKAGIVDAAIRNTIIEELVLKSKVVIYNKNFYQAISKALNTKHMIDKNTVIKIAKMSKCIDLVPVYIKYPTKRITRNILKASYIEETDPLVINEIISEGYKNFSIITENGIVDYSFKEGTREAPAKEVEKKNILDAKIKERAQELFFSYRGNGKAEENGYIQSKRERFNLLLNHWKNNKTNITPDFRVIDEVSLDLFFKVFPVEEKEIIVALSEFYKERDWKKERYSDFLQEAPSSLQRHINLKTHIKIIKETLEEMQRLNLLKKEGNTYTIISLDYPDEKEKLTISEDKRNDLYKKTVENICLSSLKEKSSILLKHLVFCSAIDEVRKSNLTLEEKKEFIFLFRRKQSKKKSYTVSHLQFKNFSKKNEFLEISGKKYTKNEIIMAVAEIKKVLIENNEINLLKDLLTIDYFLLEYIVVSLGMMGLLILPVSVIHSNNICIAPITLTPDYKKTIEIRIEYAELFCIDSLLHPLTNCTDKVLLVNSLSIVRYLIHKGTTQMTTMLSKIKHLSYFEIEQASEALPALIRIIENNSEPLKSLIVPSYTL